MNRPVVGTNPVIDRKDDETYLDFVQGLMSYLPRIQPAVATRAEAALAEFEAETGHRPRDLAEAYRALDGIPLLQTRNRLRRTIQEMKYFGIADNLNARRDELLAELDRYDRMGPGSVEYDRSWVIPDYARREIHLMPGGYVEDELAGYLYHSGTKVFFAGGNDEDQLHQANANKLPLPADGIVRRIVDIGCSSGQSATALKRRFPDAEVWGLDVGIPMVRYAHKRAVDMGLEVHFAQRLAEDTGFADNSVDLAHAFILFHELPASAAEAVVREMARILRPGGLFCVIDFGTADTERGDGGRSGPLGEVYADIDGRHNCEPYAWDFTHSDFGVMLRRHFAKVEIDPKGLPMRICTK
jgi:SAM-dependent methyltransferase